MKYISIRKSLVALILVSLTIATSGWKGCGAGNGNANNANNPDTASHAKALKRSALKRLRESEVAMKTGFDLLEELVANKLIPAEKERPMLLLLKRANSIVRSGNKIVSAIDPDKLTAANLSDIQKFSEEVVSIVRDLEASGILGIKSPKSQLSFDAILATVQLLASDVLQILSAIRAVQGLSGEETNNSNANSGGIVK